MQLTVDHIEWVDEKEWNHTANDCSWTTFYETPGWIQCQDVQNNLRSTGAGLKICFNDSLELLFPISKKNVLKGFQSHFTGVPGGLYGGPLSKDKITADHLILSIEFIKKKYSNVDFRINPFLFQFLNSNLDISKINSQNFTQAIDLNQSFNNIDLALSSSNIDYDSRYANKHQIHIETAKPTDLKSFLGVYQKMITKWGKANIEYTPAFFELLISSENCDFWAFYKADIYIGGGIFLKQNYHVSSWLTIVQSDYLKYRPYEFIYQKLINHYKSAGFHWFDFNPSAGLDGVISFKKKFGTQKLIIPEIQQTSTFVEISNRLRRNNRNA